MERGGIHGSSFVVMFCDEPHKRLSTLEKGDWVVSTDLDGNHVRGVVACVVKTVPTKPFLTYDVHYAGTQMIRHELDGFPWSAYRDFNHESVVLSTDPMYSVILEGDVIGIMVNPTPNPIMCATLNSADWSSHPFYNSGLIEI